MRNRQPPRVCATEFRKHGRRELNNWSPERPLKALPKSQAGMVSTVALRPFPSLRSEGRALRAAMSAPRRSRTMLRTEEVLAIQNEKTPIPQS